MRLILVKAAEARAARTVRTLLFRSCRVDVFDLEDAEAGIFFLGVVVHGVVGEGFREMLNEDLHS
jgi:hypothetical protein